MMYHHHALSVELMESYIPSGPRWYLSFDGRVIPISEHRDQYNPLESPSGYLYVHPVYGLTLDSTKVKPPENTILINSWFEDYRTITVM